MPAKKHFFTKEQLEQDLEELKTFTAISKKYNVTPTIISYNCKKYNIKSNKISYTCNDNFFSLETEEAFYIAGFIAADGYIIDKNKFRIKLSDKEQMFLEMIKDQLQFTGPISLESTILSNKQKYWRVVMNINSSVMITDLYKFGIGERKSKTFLMPDWLITHPLLYHFLRGYNDGDGGFSICKNKRFKKTEQIFVYDEKLVCGICGTNEFLHQLKQIFNNNLIKTDPKTSYNKGIYQICFSGTPLVNKIFDYLYKDATIYMPRKHDFVINFNSNLASRDKTKTS